MAASMDNLRVSNKLGKLGKTKKSKSERRASSTAEL